MHAFNKGILAGFGLGAATIASAILLFTFVRSSDGGDEAASFRRIVVGMDRAQVLELLGPEDGVLAARDVQQVGEQQLFWVSRSANGELAFHIVVLDRDGRVTGARSASAEAMGRRQEP